MTSSSTRAEPRFTSELILQSLAHPTLVHTSLQNPSLPSLNQHHIPSDKTRSLSDSFPSLHTDSRKVNRGDLFIALVGENQDGHTYIASAIQKGAKAIICQSHHPLSPSAATHPDLEIFYVQNTLSAFRAIAHTWRKQFDIPMIAVAGSAGKTTTKEFLAAILQSKWPSILKTQSSQNGFQGIPTTLIELRPHHSAAVIEIGIDEIGAMQQHLEIVCPTSSLLTAIGPEHLLHLKDLPTVAYEEGLALQYVAHHQGCIAICLDDPWIAPHFETLQKKYKNLSHPQKIIPYSLSHLSRPFEVLQGQLSTNGQTLSVTGFGLLNATFPLPLLGQHNAKNLLGAIAIALQLELSAEEIQKGLPHFKPTEGRSIIQPLPGPIQVLCDYYNAQPASVLAGIQLLVDMSQAQPTRGRRLVCLADMRELEPQHELLHRSLAPPLIQHGIENVLLYGTNMAFLFDELKQKNYIGIKKHFTSKADLANFLLTHVQPHDTILIKGSNSMQMVDVWKTLSQGMAHRKE